MENYMDEPTPEQLREWLIESCWIIEDEGMSIPDDAKIWWDKYKRDRAKKKDYAHE